MLAYLDKKDKGDEKKRRKKKKDSSDLPCFYCLKKENHIANECKRREEDRAKGIWRPTVRCPPMKEEEFKKLSRDEKNEGREILRTQSQTNHQQKEVGSISRGGTPAPQARGQHSGDQEEINEATWASYWNSLEN